MQTVYIVKAIEMESSEVIRAFATEPAADAFRVQCAKYHAEQPEDMFSEAYDLWAKDHPAGASNAFAHRFEVQAIQFFP